MIFEEQKVTGGKFVRVSLDSTRHVHLDGDFFMDDDGTDDGPNHPVATIERVLTGLTEELAGNGSDEGTFEGRLGGDVIERRLAENACENRSAEEELGNRFSEEVLEDHSSEGGIETRTGEHGPTCGEISKKHEFTCEEMLENGSEVRIAETSELERDLFNAAAGRIEPFMESVTGVDAAAVARAFVRVVFASMGLRAQQSVLDEAASAWTDANDSDLELTNDDVSEFWRSLLPQLHIVVDDPRDPADQMVAEEQWSHRVANGLSGPVLRFWNWRSRAIVVGRFQSIDREIHQDVAKELGFTVVRRSTGGGAMVVIPQDTITYSLYLPLDMVRGFSVKQTFQLCDAWLVAALNQLDIPARFAGLNDIAAVHGKIGGSAERRYRPRKSAPDSRQQHGSDSGDTGPQRMRNSAVSLRHQNDDATGANQLQPKDAPLLPASGALLHHTTLAYRINAGVMTRVLNTSPVKMADKHVKSAKKRVDPIANYTSLSRDELVSRIVRFLEDARTSTSH